MLDKILKLIGLQRIQPPIGVSTEITHAGAKCMSTIGRTSADGMFTIKADRVVIRDKDLPANTFTYVDSDKLSKFALPIADTGITPLEERITLIESSLSSLATYFSTLSALVNAGGDNFDLLVVEAMRKAKRNGVKV